MKNWILPRLGRTQSAVADDEKKYFEGKKPDGSRGGGGVSVGTSSHLDPAVLVVAEPDAGGHPLHLVLAAEGAGVLRVLGDLHLLHSLPQARTVPGRRSRD